MKSPKNPEAFWFNINRVYEARDEARREVNSAFKLDKPHHAFYYLDALRNLRDNELILNWIAHSMDLNRDQLKEWFDKKYEWIKEMDKKNKV